VLNGGRRNPRLLLNKAKRQAPNGPRPRRAVLVGTPTCTTVIDAGGPALEVDRVHRNRRRRHANVLAAKPLSQTAVRNVFIGGIG